MVSQEPRTKIQGKEPSDTKSHRPRTKVKNQALAKFWTKNELVSQVMNQVVNQAKKQNKIAVLQVENQAGTKWGAKQGTKGWTKSHKPRTKTRNQDPKWRTKRGSSVEPR